MNKKKVVILVLVIVLAAGAVGGGIFAFKKQKDKKTKVDVYPVSVMDMGGGYGNGESYSSGTVTDDKSQVIYLEDSDKVAEVYVKEGDKVKEGDPLMRYDMEEANLNVDMKTLDVENAENDLVIAQRELEKLKNMTPVAETPTVPDEPEEPAPKPEVPEKDGDAYNIIGKSAKSYEGKGTQEKPYRFLCTEKAYVTGEYLNYLKKHSYTAVFEIHEDNKKDGDVLNAWLVNGSNIKEEYDAESQWSVASRQEVTDEDTTEPDTTDDSADDESDSGDDESSMGYTASELAEKIREKEKEIRELDITKRKAALELEEAKKVSGDGILKASVNGTVDTACDPSDPPNDGSPFLEVRGQDSLYVTGTLSELMLGEIQTGQKVQISSWESGKTYEGEITEISTTPVDGSNYMGDGNPNASYYTYKALVKDSKGLHNGEGVDLNISQDANSGSSVLCIEKAYVRTVDGTSYVMKEDKNGRLKKQKVKTGKTYYGQAVEILSGLDGSEYIAFPYGKNVKEGVRVRETDELAY